MELQCCYFLSSYFVLHSWHRAVKLQSEADQLTDATGTVLWGLGAGFLVLFFLVFWFWFCFLCWGVFFVLFFCEVFFLVLFCFCWFFCFFV